MVLLGACLVLPLLAVRQVSASFDWRLLAAAAALISAVTWQLHAADKRSAAAGGWRTPEATLHLAEFAGGWPAAFIAMRMLRHKTAKLPYQIVYWSIVLVHQLVALDCLLGWSLTRRAAAVFSLSAA